MSNFETREKYRRSEKRITYLYRSACMGLLAISILAIVQYAENVHVQEKAASDYHLKEILIVHNYTLCSLLIAFALILLYFLRRKYHYEFQKQKYMISMFLAIEISALFL